MSAPKTIDITLTDEEVRTIAGLALAGIVFLYGPKTAIDDELIADLKADKPDLLYCTSVIKRLTSKARDAGID